MKAILILDVPENLVDKIGNKLRIVGEEYNADWKLRPLPSFKAVDLNDTRDVMMFCHGWNTCLEEITDESNISD